MTRFTKTKIHFALALLGTLFALHPFLEQVENARFDYLGYEVKVLYGYLLMAGFLGLCVYCYGLTLLTRRPHSSLELMGNYAYALAVMVAPILGGLYLSSLLAERVGQSHLAWAAPGLALALAVGWLLLSPIAVLAVRARLGKQDVNAQVEQLARREISSLRHARALFQSEHYDLSVIEVCRAVEARLRRVLVDRGYRVDKTSWKPLIAAATRAGLLSQATRELLTQLQEQWDIAMGSEPLTRKGAIQGMSTARRVLGSIALSRDPRPGGRTGTSRDQRPAA
jgi:HEPN domain-containing protein